MSTKVNVSAAVVEKFRSENSDLDYLLNELRNAAFEAIDKLSLEVEEKLKTYKELSEEAAKLIGKAGNLRAQAESVSSYISSKCTKLDQMLSGINNSNDAYYAVDKIIEMSRSAEEQLKAAVAAIQAYVGLYLPST